MYRIYSKFRSRIDQRALIREKILGNEEGSYVLNKWRTIKTRIEYYIFPDES